MLPRLQANRSIQHIRRRQCCSKSEAIIQRTRFTSAMNNKESTEYHRQESTEQIRRFIIQQASGVVSNKQAPICTKANSWNKTCPTSQSKQPKFPMPTSTSQQPSHRPSIHRVDLNEFTDDLSGAHQNHRATHQPCSPNSTPHRDSS